MFVDSKITEILIDRFTYHYECPILCIHDSYIVPWGYDRKLAGEMQIAFEKVTGIKRPVVKPTIDYFDNLEIPPNPEEDQGKEFVNSYQPSDRFLRDKEEFRLAKNKPPYEPWYPYWTAIY